MFEHKSVLQEEAIEGLNIQSNGIYVDCTLGGGGHSEAILKQLAGEGHLFAFDQDEEALTAARDNLRHHLDHVTFIRSNFRHLTEELNKHQIKEVDGILFDLGVSSPQFDQVDRGFSYHHDARLDMRMDQTADLDAHDIINTWPYNDLVKIFFKYGEEKFSKQIARRIEQERKKQPIDTTTQLSDIIKSGIPAAARRKGGHPAKRIFQAVRIAVNDELNVFEDALNQAAQLIAPGGRVAVITFHSLEDRLCKQTFKALSTPEDIPKNLPVLPEDHEAPFCLINRKPITADESELETNRRSRSAKLRILKRKSSLNNTQKG